MLDVEYLTVFLFVGGSMAVNLRTLAFLLDPESAHSLTKKWLKASGFGIPKSSVEDSRLEQTLLGRKFRNPVGLAAGFDKEAELINAMTKIGFGFVEVGTVTPRPQYGNPKPRIARFEEHQALQNWLGFNNLGMEAEYESLKEYPYKIPVGVNVGKNKDVPNERALDDYKSCIKRLHTRADYITVNISSPNTVGLRDLQNEEFVRSVLKMAKGITKKPVFIKISPDMQHKQAIALSLAAIKNGATGIIATNTTIDYKIMKGARDKGGISGSPLKEKSFKMIRELGKAMPSKALLISVGGIDSAKEAYRRILAGASLVQVYTGLVYHGFELVNEINAGLLWHIKKDGFDNISEAVGYKVA